MFPIDNIEPEKPENLCSEEDGLDKMLLDSSEPFYVDTNQQDWNVNHMIQTMNLGSQSYAIPP